LRGGGISPLTGTLGVLGSAYQRALINDPLDALAEIRRHGFYISDALITKFEVLLNTRYTR
jgi:predicted nucleic acid-binding protein